MDGADCSTFAAVRRGNVRGGRGASANPSNAGVFWGVECARRVRAGDYPPEHSRRVQGRFSRDSRGAGSPPSASAWPAPRSPESARGANSPNALARGGGKQSRTAQQGKRFSVRPSGVGGFGRMRRAGRVRGRRRDSPPVRRRDIFRYQLLSENIRARCAVRLAKSGVGARRECPGKGAPRPAPHNATGKAFFRPPVRSRRVQANPARNAPPRPAPGPRLTRIKCLVAGGLPVRTSCRCQAAVFETALSLPPSLCLLCLLPPDFFRKHPKAYRRAHFSH